MINKQVNVTPGRRSCCAASSATVAGRRRPTPSRQRALFSERKTTAGQSQVDRSIAGRYGQTPALESHLRHEVVAGHHGDLHVDAGLLDDFLYGLSARQRVHAARVAHHADPCGGDGVSSRLPWKQAKYYREREVSFKIKALIINENLFFLRSLNLQVVNYMMMSRNNS